MKDWRYIIFLILKINAGYGRKLWKRDHIIPVSSSVMHWCRDWQGI